MAQKIIKVGDSAAVTLPKRLMENLGLKPGDSVVVDLDAKKQAIVVEAVAKVNPELYDWTQRFIGRYKHDLEELAEK